MRELRSGYHGFNVLFLVFGLAAAINLIYILASSIGTLSILETIKVAIPYILWLLGCTIYFSIKKYPRIKAMKKGVCQDGEIVEFKYHPQISFHRLYIGYGVWTPRLPQLPHPFNVTIKYKNHLGNIMLCDSKWYYYNLPLKKERFKAKIWLNPEDEKNKYIQLFYD